MRLKILSLFAALALVSACETAPEESAAGSGTGATQPTTKAKAAPAKKTETATRAVAPAAQPTGPLSGSVDEFIVSVGDRVFFDLDKFNLTADARGILERQAAWLKKNGAVMISIEGHCDERGTREYNLALGERRATAVKDYLMSLGVSAGRINVVSYGKERPEALGSNETAWRQNRRGVTKIMSGASG
jgi:peptidoglycan-associated lipoprotein